MENGNGKSQLPHLNVTLPAADKGGGLPASDKVASFLPDSAAAAAAAAGAAKAKSQVIAAARLHCLFCASMCTVTH
jgi:hypothetical protein